MNECKSYVRQSLCLHGSICRFHTYITLVVFINWYLQIIIYKLKYVFIIYNLLLAKLKLIIACKN